MLSQTEKKNPHFCDIDPTQFKALSRKSRMQAQNSTQTSASPELPKIQASWMGKMEQNLHETRNPPRVSNGASLKGTLHRHLANRAGTAAVSESSLLPTLGAAPPALSLLFFHALTPPSHHAILPFPSPILTPDAQSSSRDRLLSLLCPTSATTTQIVRTIQAEELNNARRDLQLVSEKGDLGHGIFTGKLSLL